MPPSISTTWWRLLAVTWITLCLFSTVATALQVAPGSPCASVCQDRNDGDGNDAKGSTTSVKDIACEDPDFDSRTIRGMKFKECTQCLQSSRYTSGEETDLMWYLYNLRYAANVCLYNYPEAVQNKSFACDIPSSCGGLKTALREGDLKAESITQLEYCSADNEKMKAWAIKSCTSCLWNAPESKYLSNFMVALDAACVQRPKAGDLVGLTGSLFTSYAVNITDPPKLETGPPPPAQTNMDTGTIIGIAIGAALVLLLGVGLFVVYWRKQKRAKVEEERRVNSDSPNDGGSSITALNIGGGGGGPGSGGGRHGYTTDYKREIGLTSFESYDASRSGGLNSNRVGNYTNSGEYYDQLEKYQQRAAAQQYGMLNHTGPADSLPAHPAYIPRAAMAQQQQQRNSTDSRGSRNTATSSQNLQQQFTSNQTLVAQNSQQQRPVSTQTLSAQHLQQQQTTRRTSPRSSPRLVPEPITLSAVPASKQRYAKTTTEQASQPSLSTSSKSAIDSYTMQKYLAAEDDRPGHTMPPPPAQKPPRAAKPFDPANPPPPPPQPAVKIPSLGLPSVPRVRVPKQYAPPRISVEEATPTDAAGGEGHFVRTGTPGSRSSSVSRDGRPPTRGRDESNRVGGASPSGRVIRQTVNVTRPRQEEIPIASGKTVLYS
ncbi:hypothetical protein MCOR03_005420 [Pyricularia oryzae]|nr:hypothetical protein MCOR19_010838 [Pyricularia oryzae]KAI6310967.1 hypothetical protein MCOR30_010971 [Pyricularia oryzae]KAI6372663.1 hypothetical protein MCOR31_003579 [Pyricularia oryzae]KAI6421343.1 hypothetical protein MCOR21_009311 [Pyricularia oryzae]KAI6428380.1 hypothetical protein MCOR22_010504 [Pyricularia oryzae]